MVTKDYRVEYEIITKGSEYVKAKNAEEAEKIAKKKVERDDPFGRKLKVRNFKAKKFPE